MAKAKDRYALRVQQGQFVPADRATQLRLREKGFRAGDLVFVEFRKPRNPKFHGLAHQLGVLCSENIDAFEGMDPHRVLKRLQLEARVGCDEMAIIVPGFGKCLHLIPRSLSYESMDEAEFYEVVKGFSRYISSHYWPSLEPEQIEKMIGVMIDE